MRLALLRGGDGLGARVAIDRTASMPGRGAYLCRAGLTQGPAQECLERASRRGGVARALRCKAKIDISDLVESMGQ